MGMRGSRKFRQGGPENFIAINLFHRGSYGPPLLLDGVSTSVSKLVIFQEGSRPPVPLLDPQMMGPEFLMSRP